MILFFLSELYHTSKVKLELALNGFSAKAPVNKSNLNSLKTCLFFRGKVTKVALKKIQEKMS